MYEIEKHKKHPLSCIFKIQLGMIEQGFRYKYFANSSKEP